MPLVEWMESEGVAVDYLRQFDWENFDREAVTEDVVDRLLAPVSSFFMTRTRAELLEGAVEHHAMLCPVATTEDALESVQLAARGYWAELEHPELGTSITYPGAFVKASETPLMIDHPAPTIGQHNQEIYGEIGLSNQNIILLSQNRVI